MIRLALVLLSVALASSPARAQETHEAVVLAAEDPDAAVVARVHDELVAMGLRVSLAPPETTLEQLSARWPELGAAAAVHVARTSEVTILVRGQAAPRRIAASDDPATVALAAAEALRGFLVRVPAGATPVTSSSEQADERAGAVAPSGAAATHEADPPADARALALHAGPAWMLSPGGIPDQLALAVGADVYLVGRAYLEIVADVGVPGLTVTGKRDEIPIWTAALGAGLGYSLLPSESPVDLSVAGGVAALAILFEARNTTSATFAAVPYLRFVARLRVTSALAIRADAAAGFAFPSPEIEIKGRNPTFGRPLVTLAASVELGW